MNRPYPQHLVLPPVLSIRQPWAWLIVHGFKDIENRSWWTAFRGTFLVHAGKGMTIREYEEARVVAAGINPSIDVPDPKDLPRGGIVGEAESVNCVTVSDSPWFFGPHGIVIFNARPLPFFPCRGALGFFNLKPWMMGE